MSWYRRWLLKLAGVGVGALLASNYAMGMDLGACGSGGGAAMGSVAMHLGARSSERVVEVRRDSLLDAKWAVLVDCDHPEWPARMVLLGKDATEVKPQVRQVSAVRAVAMVVRVGETVRVWERDGMTSIETTGIAEQSGAAGKRIEVRLLRSGMNSEDRERLVEGVIAGPGSVEIHQ